MINYFQKEANYTEPSKARSYQWFSLLLILLVFWLLSSCKQEVVVDAEEEPPTLEEAQLEDTLRLVEGSIPESWVKVDLMDGYYIGFPKEPRKKESRHNHRVDYKLKRNKYRFYVSLTDLSEEPSFQANGSYREAYYQAIIDDLADELEAEVLYEEPFYSQKIYEGLRATIGAEDVRIYLQCIIIESVLYTISLTIFDEEKPIYLQLKDKLFYSFGNNRYKNAGEQTTSVDSSANH